jgi:hypothetical protein
MAKCEDCKYYKDRGTRKRLSTGHYKYGTCHISPPTTDGFPEVEPDDFCKLFEYPRMGKKRRKNKDDNNSVITRPGVILGDMDDEDVAKA